MNVYELEDDVILDLSRKVLIKDKQVYMLTNIGPWGTNIRYKLVNFGHFANRWSENSVTCNSLHGWEITGKDLKYLIDDEENLKNWEIRIFDEIVSFNL